MMITIPQPQRFALKWLAAWRVIKRENRQPIADDFDTLKGVMALALEVPQAAPAVDFELKRGHPKGQKKTGGVQFFIPALAHDPLCRLAAVYGLVSPQEVVRVFALEILKAAPHVELDCSADENFAAIDRLIAAMRKRCVQDAVAIMRENPSPLSGPRAGEAL